MSLNKSFFDRETNIKVTVIAYSISPSGRSMISVEIEAPRIILAEINTHNALSKNCSSTRAITLAKAIQQIENNAFTPIYWGEKQKGMAAENEIPEEEQILATAFWNMAKANAICAVNALDDQRVHKQIAGRLLEPFQMVKQVLSGTDWDNFFNLRIHPDAQPEILMLAYKIHQAIAAATPFELRAGEWHLPYVDRERDQYTGELRYFQVDTDTTGTETDGYKYEIPLTLEEAQQVSASCCAQVSYRNTDQSLTKALGIFDRLISADVLHASPFEHLATPIQEEHCAVADDCYNIDESVNLAEFPETWEKGITHLKRNGEFGSGNLGGFISYRHLMENNTCWQFNFQERMELFK